MQSSAAQLRPSPAANYLNAMTCCCIFLASAATPICAMALPAVAMEAPTVAVLAAVWTGCFGGRQSGQHMCS